MMKVKEAWEIEMEPKPTAEVKAKAIQVANDAAARISHANYLLSILKDSDRKEIKPIIDSILE